MIQQRKNIIFYIILLCLFPGNVSAQFASTLPKFSSESYSPLWTSNLNGIFSFQTPAQLLSDIDQDGTKDFLIEGTDQSMQESVLVFSGKTGLQISNIQKPSGAWTDALSDGILSVSDSTTIPGLVLIESINPLTGSSYWSYNVTLGHYTLDAGVLEDFTGDNKKDFYVTSRLIGLNSFAVYFFDGVSGNSISFYYSTTSLSYPRKVVSVGDINGDGHKDVVVPSISIGSVGTLEAINPNTGVPFWIKGPSPSYNFQEIKTTTQAGMVYLLGLIGGKVVLLDQSGNIMGSPLSPCTHVNKFLPIEDIHALSVVVFGQNVCSSGTGTIEKYNFDFSGGSFVVDWSKSLTSALFVIGDINKDKIGEVILIDYSSVPSKIIIRNGANGKVLQKFTLPLPEQVTGLNLIGVSKDELIIPSSTQISVFK